MRSSSLLRFSPVLVLVAGAATAKGHAPVERTLILSEHPRREVPSVYVGGRISTLLRLEAPCVPERTTLLGGEGLFEPVVCAGRTVVLYPSRDLTPGDRFLLRVTLEGGKELPFVVTAHEQSYEDREIDQQVNVFEDRHGYDAVLSSLYSALGREKELSEENERHRREENSVDHAYATLLAHGAVKQTPFVVKRTAVVKEGDLDARVEVLSGKRKVAVIVHLTNTSANTPWLLGETRLSADLTLQTAKPFALRKTRDELVPGASGVFAVVADQSAFTTEQGLVSLTLEMFREDGLQQLSVLLDHRLLRE